MNLQHCDWSEADVKSTIRVLTRRDSGSPSTLPLTFLLVDAHASIATIRQRLRRPVLRIFLTNLFSSFSSVVSQILPGMAGETDDEQQALFSQCRFIIVRNEALTHDAATAVCF